MTPSLITSGPVQRVSPEEGYRLWSRSYDAESNPLLSLEQRILWQLLPAVEGSDVVDLGCGTGRWLERLASLKPRSLLGIDSSSYMLVHAKRKLGNQAELLVENCEKWQPQPQSADLILGSFLLSYIEDLAALGSIVKRMLRVGGTVFLSDLHPETIRKLGWRRSFHLNGMSIEITTQERTLEQITSTFENAGLEICAVLEPSFGDPDRVHFVNSGRDHQWNDVSRYPALYILGLRQPQLQGVASSARHAPETLSAIHSCRIALGARDAVASAVQLKLDRILSIGEPTACGSQSAASSLDLRGYLLFPGLINSHDHLEFALFPRLGRGGYKNFLEWAEDIHCADSSTVREHRNIPREARLRWGGIRNLLCGVTTVSHHNPYEEAVFENRFPVRVVREYGWAHSFALDGDAASKRRATPPGRPFIMHLAEGIDAHSAADIEKVAREFPLDSQCVFVHCLGLDASGREMIRQSGAALVWCPSSNVFLFGRTLGAGELRSFPGLVLGNDSPLTAEGDLLDEIRFALEHTEIQPDELYKMVTKRAARVLGLQDGEGTIQPGARADFFAVRDQGLSPARTLGQISQRNVELVVVGGHIHLASPEIMRRASNAVCEGLNPLRVDGELRWVREDTNELFRAACCSLGHRITMGGRSLDI
jgi:cytosine/adenosine deaminase-related metal-dependent hydrolase/ubiquinone/menaquinone biosynthesis C-methylase UbiE